MLNDTSSPTSTQGHLPVDPRKILWGGGSKLAAILIWLRDYDVQSGAQAMPSIENGAVLGGCTSAGRGLERSEA